MIVYKKENISEIKECVACIGYFDGVHLGHQVLIKKTIELASKQGLMPLIISFYPDPESIIFKKEVNQITSLENRLELFEKYGINNCLLLDFDEDLMNMSAKSFIDEYILIANVKTLVCGFDFKFGKNASGNINILKETLKTIEIPEVKYNDKKISSTYIRELIKEGNLELAHKLLGHE